MSQKSFPIENKHHVGMEPSKPAKQDGSDTTTHLHHPYIFCHFANYAQQNSVYTLNEHSTQHC